MTHESIFEKKLSYKISGIFIQVSQKYGYLYKEEVYHKACAERFDLENIEYQSNPKINIYSLDTGKRLSTYIPDFLVEDKIIIEIKALEILPKTAINQLEQYLKASKYEVGYLVNFGKPKAQIIRRIYTNDRKPWLKNP